MTRVNSLQGRVSVPSPKLIADALEVELWETFGVKHHSAYRHEYFLSELKTPSSS